MLAMAKARQLANEGFETLLVCFNSPLARVLADETRDVAEQDRPPPRQHVPPARARTSRARRTRCRRSPTRSRPGGSRTSCAIALDEAIGSCGPSLPRDRGRRGSGLRHRLARVARGAPLRREGGRPVRLPRSGAGDLPCRPDRGAGADRIPPRLQLPQRAADPRAASSRFAKGGLSSVARREDGRPVELIEADDDAADRRGAAQGPPSAGRGRGRRARVDRGADRFRPRALGRLEAAALRQPGPVERRGRRRRTAARAGRADVPEQPPDVVLCDSIRRFKGLERPVIVLLEIPRDDPDRLDRLLYIGASRARQHLVVIAPVAVMRRLEHSGDIPHHT